jgi:hypothetical protein
MTMAGMLADVLLMHKQECTVRNVLRPQPFTAELAEITKSESKNYSVFFVCFVFSVVKFWRLDSTRCVERQRSAG